MKILRDLEPFFQIYIACYVLAMLAGAALMLRERQRLALFSTDYRKFLGQPWRLATFVIAAAGITLVAPYTGDPDLGPFRRADDVGAHLPHRAMGDRHALFPARRARAAGRGVHRRRAVDDFGVLVLRPLCPVQAGHVPDHLGLEHRGLLGALRMRGPDVESGFARRGRGGIRVSRTGLAATRGRRRLRPHRLVRATLHADRRCWRRLFFVDPALFVNQGGAATWPRQNAPA